MVDSAKKGGKERDMTGSLVRGNSEGPYKQPSARASTEQVEGVGRVTPSNSSETRKTELDPNRRV